MNSNLHLATALPLMILTSCSDGAERVCDPGVVRSCPCGGGEPDGTQVCSEDGELWSSCECGWTPTDGDADGDTDADGDSDVDVDVDGDADGDSDADGDVAVDSDTDVGCVPGCPGGSCGDGDWARICAGSFVMGSPVTEVGHDDGEVQHEVTLTRDFELLSVEVSHGSFAGLLGGYSPWSFDSCGDLCPVETISWHEAAAFCNALSEAYGYDDCYECSGSGESVTCALGPSYATPYDCPGYRLPTEAEWEYAARAGTSTATYNGDLDVEQYERDAASDVLDPIAWWGGTSGETPHEVATLEPNAWGLNDMLGNVYEWCHDWHDDLTASAAVDPSGPSTGSDRVFRGGGWGVTAGFARAAWRPGIGPESRRDYIGLRPARTLP